MVGVGAGARGAEDGQVFDAKLRHRGHRFADPFATGRGADLGDVIVDLEQRFHARFLVRLGGDQPPTDEHDKQQTGNRHQAADRRKSKQAKRRLVRELRTPVGNADFRRDRNSVVEGNRVDLDGRRFLQ